jgi:hypothetical protein
MMDSKRFIFHTLVSMRYVPCPMLFLEAMGKAGPGLRNVLSIRLKGPPPNSGR